MNLSAVAPCMSREFFAHSQGIFDGAQGIFDGGQGIDWAHAMRIM